MALEKLGGVTAVYANDSLTVLYHDVKQIDQKKVLAIMKKHKMAASGVSRMKKLPY